MVLVGKRGVQGACGVCVVSVRLAFFTWRGSLDLAAQAIALYATLFHLSIQGAATEFSVQRQMNRARGARVIRRSVQRIDLFIVCSPPARPSV